MRNPNISIDGLLTTFVAVAEESGLRRRPPQRLAVPYFRGEFNRCVEHEPLNTLLCTPYKQEDPGWYQVSMACRTADTKKIEFGWHSTVFEMLTAIWRADVDGAATARARLASEVVRLLVTVWGLDPGRLRATYFGGGEVIPGLEVEADEAGRSAFAGAGISPGNLVPVRGPKNFVLFVGDGERAGPKYEIQYLVPAQHGERWVEVATAIFDSHRFRRDPTLGSWQLQTPRSILWGCAFGVERLAAALQGASNIWCSPVLVELLSAIRGACKQDGAAAQLLDGDALILADLVRSSMFLMADGISPNDVSKEGSLLISLLRRLRRKTALLAIRDWHAVIAYMATVIVRHYEMRYPVNTGVRDTLLDAVGRVPWPEGWNPETYDPAVDGSDG